MQACPAFRNFSAAAPFAARTGSASGNTMNGAWPPSSTDTRLRLPAATPARCFPTGVEPVKVSFRTRGSVVNTSPIGLGSSAVTRFTTPGGVPTSSKISNTARAHSGVASAGFNTSVHPAASAGAILRVSIEIG
jgi:hypothetical protein